MDTNAIKKAAFKALLEDIAAWYRKDFSGPQIPSLKSVNELLADLRKQFSLSFNDLIQSGEYLRKAIYKDTVYSFATGEWHLKLAYLWDCLNNLSRIRPEDVQAAFANNSFGDSWDQYYKEFKKQIAEPPAEYIGEKYWATRKTDDKNFDNNILLKQFIQHSRTELIPYLLANEIRLGFDQDQAFTFKGNEKEVRASLRDCILLAPAERQLIVFSSKMSGEGKTSFIWDFIYSAYTSFDFVWLNDPQIDLGDLPPLDYSDVKRVVIILDKKLNQIDNRDIDIALLWNYFNLAYKGRKITLLIIENEYFVNRYNPVSAIGHHFASVVCLDNFKISVEENGKILDRIINLFGINQEEKAFSINDFRRNDALPLAYKIGNLIEIKNRGQGERDLWTKDSRVKDVRLEYLYFLVALCGHYNIKFPIDYISEIFLKDADANSIIELIYNTEDLGKIIKVSDGYRLDYPHQFLTLANQDFATNYVTSHAEALIQANRFIDELTGYIKKGTAKECHSYVFRKIYALPKAVMPGSNLREQLLSFKRINLLDRLILLNDWSEEDANKNKAEKALEFLRQGKDQEAADSVKEMEGDSDGMVAYLKAKIHFARGNILECLDELKEEKLRPNIAVLRNECFLFDQLQYLDLGIQYYFQQLKTSGLATMEFNLMLECFNALMGKHKYSTLENYFSILKNQNRSYNTNTHILYAEANMYYKWAKFELKYSQTSSKEKDSDSKLALAKDIINRVKTLYARSNQFLLLEAKILGWKNEFGKAIKILTELSAKSPTQLDLNFLIAEMYHNRPKSSDEEIEKHNRQAVLYLERNLQTIREMKSTIRLRIPTYILLSQVYPSIGKFDEAKVILKELIYDPEFKGMENESKLVYKRMSDILREEKIFNLDQEKAQRLKV